MTADTSRVPHDKLMTLAAEAEMEEWPVTSAWYWPRMMALDLRDARTTLAERDREVERLKADVVDAHTVLQAAEARVRVLREAAGQAHTFIVNYCNRNTDAIKAKLVAALSDTPKEEPRG
jgi:phytoene dehydrogenase-like protein